MPLRLKNFRLLVFGLFFVYLAGTYFGPFNTGGVVLKIVDLFTARMPGDVNKDCEVNFLDFAEVALNWLENTLR